MRFVPKVDQVLPIVWQVCFMGVERISPWDWFLPLGFRHTFLLGYLPGTDWWLCYDVLFFKTEISLVSGDKAGFLLNKAHLEGAVLNWNVAGFVKPDWRPRFGFWCVPAVKHVLGVRCVAMTPKGLHDYLLRNGAKPLIEEK